MYPNLKCIIHCIKSFVHYTSINRGSSIKKMKEKPQKSGIHNY